MRTHALPRIFLLILGSMPPAHAAGPAGADAHCPDTTATCLDQVQVTATKRPQSTLDVAVATTVVGPEQMRELAPQTVMDALHGEVGTFVQQTTPGQGVVIVRGLKGSEVLHLVDGFRLNNAIFRNSPNQYIALVDAQATDRLEVVRGPSGTLYGGDAMGGVVHMLGREPAYGAQRWQVDGRLRAILASADESTVSRAEFAAAGPRAVFSGGVSYQDVNDLRVGGGERLRPTGFTARAGDARLRVQVADGHELIASVQYLKQPRTPRHDALVPGFGQGAPDNDLFFFEPQERRFAQVRWKVGAPSAAFDEGQVGLGRQEIIDDRRTRGQGAGNEDHEANADRLTGVHGQFGKALGDAHYFSYGLEYYRDEVRSSKYRVNLETGAVSPRDPRFPDGSRMTSRAVYLADDWHAGERVDLTLGARWSRFLTTIADTATAAGVRVDADDLTGNIGLSVAIGPSTRLVSNLGRGFRAPNVFDLGVFGERPGGRFSVPNADLGPETVDTLDAGLKWGGATFSGELIGWRSRYRDKITGVVTGERVDAEGQPCVGEDCLQVVENRNVTVLDLWGIEAGGRYHDVERHLEFYATATWTRGDEQFEGERYPADRVPPLFGKAGVLWHASPTLDLEAYSHYASEQDRLSPRDLDDPRVNPNGTGGWATFNARVAWQAGERLALALRAENLGDKRYREHGTGLDEPGRNVTLTADVRF